MPWRHPMYIHKLYLMITFNLVKYEFYTVLVHDNIKASYTLFKIAMKAKFRFICFH